MFYWPNIRKFKSWKEKNSKSGDPKEERKGIEGKVSYSVSGDLQIT